MELIFFIVVKGLFKKYSNLKFYVFGSYFYETWEKL